MSVEIAYQVILSDAVTYANRELSRRGLWFLGGDFFSLPRDGQFDTLALDFDPDQFRTAVRGAKADEDDTYEQLKDIVRSAINFGVSNNPGMVGGLVMDEIRRHAAS